MTESNPYKDFTQRLKLLIRKHPTLITMTLSNIFTMRLIGNKTHGDLAEIAISEFVNQYMYDFTSTHVGKDLYRAKSKEEDISVRNDMTQEEMLISLKAYGVGPLQLSTDKSARMFPRLADEGDDVIQGRERIQAILGHKAFQDVREMNVLPLIYDEKRQRCNIMVFDFDALENQTAVIEKITSGRGRKHPIFRFLDKDEGYICEVRYGGADANALQRGLWTHTQKAIKHFDSITNGWIDYSHNLVLVKLFAHALVSSEKGHQEALNEIKRDIQSIVEGEGL